jgi:Domain of unknown function (DUF4419)
MFIVFNDSPAKAITVEKSSLPDAMLSSVDLEQKYYATKYGLYGAYKMASLFDLTLKITPDDIWIAIMHSVNRIVLDNKWMNTFTKSYERIEIPNIEADYTDLIKCLSKEIKMPVFINDMGSTKPIHSIMNLLACYNTLNEQHVRSDTSKPTTVNSVKLDGSLDDWIQLTVKWRHITAVFNELTKSYEINLWLSQISTILNNLQKAFNGQKMTKWFNDIHEWMNILYFKKLTHRTDEVSVVYEGCDARLMSGYYLTVEDNYVSTNYYFYLL